MKIQINEVWNADGRSKKLAVVDVEWASLAPQAVWDWIMTNRPDLKLAEGLHDHGFHAIAI